MIPLPSFGVSLQIIDIILRDCEVPTQMAQWLFEGLRKLPHLRHLYIFFYSSISNVSLFEGSLRSVVIKELACRSWYHVLQASLTSLVDLEIGESECMSHFELDLLLKGCRSVERLNLRFTWYRSLPPLPGLKWLYLCYLAPGSDLVPLKEMVPHLGASQDLKVFNLYGFQMADDAPRQLAQLHLQQMELFDSANTERIVASCVGPGNIQTLVLSSFHPGTEHGLCHSIIPSCNSSLVVLELPWYRINVDLISVLVDCQSLAFLSCLAIEYAASEWIVQKRRMLPLRYLIIWHLKNLSPLITSRILQHLHGLCVDPEAMSPAWRHLAEIYAFELESAAERAQISRWKSRVHKPLVTRPFQIVSARDRL
ncbi:hypothetical protein BT69DRAFT_752264 [Atractiella rhizophila]|nr:hypothetical protein BT69DRAFT_752264 [Atractiella rhizophila]